MATLGRFTAGVFIYFMAWVAIGTIYELNSWEQLSFWQGQATAIPIIIAVCISTAICREKK